MHWIKIVYYIFLVLSLFASFRGYRDPKYSLFIPLLAVSLLVEVLREFPVIKDSAFGQTLSFFIAVEYTFLCLIISRFIRSPFKKNLIIASIFLVAPALILITWKIASQSKAYQYLDLLVSAPFICIWTILYLFESATENEAEKIEKSPIFWISLGNLLFFSGSFFSYGFGSYMIAKGRENVGEAIFWIARILNIFLYFFYFVGLLCLPKRK